MAVDGSKLLDLRNLTAENLKSLTEPDRSSLMISGIPAELKAKIEADATAKDTSVAALARQHLAAAYDYDLTQDETAEKNRKAQKNALMDMLLAAVKSGKIDIASLAAETADTPA